MTRGYLYPYLFGTGTLTAGTCWGITHSGMKWPKDCCGYPQIFGCFYSHFSLILHCYKDKFSIQIYYYHFSAKLTLLIKQLQLSEAEFFL